MMTKRKKRPRGLEGRRARAGVLFILPWLIGFFGMFVRSLVTSLVYSVSKTTIADFGMNTEYIGFDYYYRALFIDSNFVRSLIEEVGGMLPQVVIILAFSLMMAVILSGSFKGRTFFRSVFFLPVICGSGLIWQSGLQILLFISGIMGISTALYEAAKIEGATAWESFWKITFPMLSPIMVLNAVYSIIDRFIDYNNGVLQYILGFAQKLDFSYSSAMAWLYFLVVGVLVGVVYIIINKRIVYTVE